jgi:biofilm PGA synthesis N-glycosyltransferase PgaC
MASQAEFLMCIDADALLDRQAIHWMMLHFQDGPRVGAVTGNPCVLNKKKLLSRIQIGEFAAIIGMVKRSQRGIGRLFTVSGVNVCFRHRALHDVRYWSPETVTEDIDISWKLQLKYWDIRYEPRSLVWIFVPDTLKGLWRQRLRWARGGAEAALKYSYLFKKWSMRRMWPVYLEYLVGALWCYAFTATVLFWLGTNLLGSEYWPEALWVNSLLPGWTGVLLAVTCLLQFTVGLFLDSHYEKRIMKNLYWAIWYPVIYWMLSCFTTVVAIPQAIFHSGGTRYATWKSPERGVL